MPPLAQGLNNYEEAKHLVTTYITRIEKYLQSLIKGHRYVDRALSNCGVGIS